MPPFAGNPHSVQNLSRLLITTDAASSVWAFTLDLARALRPRGVEIALAIMGPPPSPKQQADAAALGHVELFASPYALEWMADPWEDVTRAGEWLLGLEDDFAPEAVHLNGCCHGSLPWNAPVLIAVPQRALARWQTLKDWPASGEWARYRSEMACGLRGADLVVASSGAALETIREICAPSPVRFQAKVIPAAQPPQRVGEDYLECYRQLLACAPNPLEAPLFH